MAKIEIRQPIPGKSPSACYQACLDSVSKSGYTLFKKREVAFLVICTGTLQGVTADLTLMATFGNPTNIVVSLSSSQASEPDLEAEARRILALITSGL